MPLAANSPFKTLSISVPAAERVVSLIKISFASHKSSIRAVIFMGAPTNPYLARRSEPMLPATTVPVLIAMPVSIGGSPFDAF